MATKARKGLNRLIVTIGAVIGLPCTVLALACLWVGGMDWAALFGALVVAGFLVPFILFRLGEWVCGGFAQKPEDPEKP
jgi:hypothetical protein